MVRVSDADARLLFDFMVDETGVREDLFRSGGIDDHQLGLCIGAAQTLMVELGRPFTFVRHHVEGGESSAFVRGVSVLLATSRRTAAVCGLADPSHWTCVYRAHRQYLFLRDSIVGDVVLGAGDVAVADDDFAARGYDRTWDYPVDVDWGMDPFASTSSVRPPAEPFTLSFDRRQVFVLEAVP